MIGTNFCNISESDLILCLVTFVSCLVLPLEIGILIGVVINIISLLHSAARPKISIETLKVMITHIIRMIFTPFV